MSILFPPLAKGGKKGFAWRKQAGASAPGRAAVRLGTQGAGAAADQGRSVVAADANDVAGIETQAGTKGREEIGAAIACECGVLENERATVIDPDARTRVGRHCHISCTGTRALADVQPDAMRMVCDLHVLQIGRRAPGEVNPPPCALIATHSNRRSTGRRRVEGTFLAYADAWAKNVCVTVIRDGQILREDTRAEVDIQPSAVSIAQNLHIIQTGRGPIKQVEPPSCTQIATDDRIISGRPGQVKGAFVIYLDAGVPDVCVAIIHDGQ